MKKIVIVLGLVITSLSSANGGGCHRTSEIQALVSIIQQLGQANGAALGGNFPLAEMQLQGAYQRLMPLVAQGQNSPLLRPVERQLFEASRTLGNLQIPPSPRAATTIDQLAIALAEAVTYASVQGGYGGALQGAQSQIRLAHQMSEQGLMAVAEKLASQALRLLMSMGGSPMTANAIAALNAAVQQMNDPRLVSPAKEQAVCRSLTLAEQALAVSVQPMPMPYPQTVPGYGYPQQRPNYGGYPANHGGYPQGSYPQGGGRYPNQPYGGTYSEGNYPPSGAYPGGGYPSGGYGRPGFRTVP